VLAVRQEMAAGNALHLGHRCADYVVTRLVWQSGTRLTRCECLM